MSFGQKIKNWTSRHRFFSGFLLAVIILVFLAVVFIIGLDSLAYKTFTGPSDAAFGIHPVAESPGSGFLSFVDIFSPSRDVAAPVQTTMTELEVKEATLNIKSDDAEREGEDIRFYTEREGKGYVERSRKYESSTLLRISMNVRVANESFEEFIDLIKKEFNVKSYTVNNFRIPIQREMDERDILEKALENYGHIRDEIMMMDTNQHKIDLLMRNTEKELELQRMKTGFERELTDKQIRSDLSTVEIVLEQKLKANIWPEDVVNRFRDNLRIAFDSVVDSLVKIFTGGIALFFKAVQWIVYAVIVIVPVLFVYRLGKKIYYRLGLDKKKEDPPAEHF